MRKLVKRIERLVESLERGMILVNVGDVILFAEETYFSSALLQMEFQSSGEGW